MHSTETLIDNLSTPAFRLSRKEYRSLWSAIWGRRNQRNVYAWIIRIASALIMAALWAGIVFAFDVELSTLEVIAPHAYWSIVSFLTAAALYLVLCLVQVPLVSRVHLWDDGAVAHDSSVSISSDGVETRSDRCVTKYDWSAILDIFVHKGLLLFRLDGAMFVFVPSHAFATQGEFERFRDLATRLWEKQGQSG